jgi:drug/metabolite transporter (DMT)-like permease
MGLTGGVMFAMMNVMIRKDQHHSIQVKSLALYLGVMLVGLSHSLLLPSPFALTKISIDSWLLMLMIGVVVFGLSLIMQYGLTHIAANRASVIMLFELVVAAIAAYFLANETMALKEWMGGAMIVSASLFSARMNQK